MDQAEGLRKLVGDMRPPVSPKVKQLPVSGRGQKIISVTSGKGGVGKTNFSVNLGIALQKKGAKVLIFDADIGLANVNLLMGKNFVPEFNLTHFVNGKKSLPEIITKGPFGINVIAGASGLLELIDMSEKKKDDIIKTIGSIERDYDYVIFDTGAGISKTVLQFNLAADDIIIITTPEPTSISDAYGMIKAISKRMQAPRIKLVINRIRSLKEGRIVSEKIIDTASSFLNVRTQLLGFIPEDRKLQRSVAKREPFYTAYPASAAAKCIDIISGKLSNEVISGKKGLKGFLTNILKAVK